MTGDENPRKKKRRLLGIIFSLISIAVLTYIAIRLISGQELGISRLTGLFKPRTPVAAADEYNFDVGGNRVFADLGGSLAAAGTFGVQVLDISGAETLRDPFRMTSPAISAATGRAVAFDIGGTAVRVFDETRITASIEETGTVISASINQNGWFCVCSQERGAFRSIVTAYDNRGRDVYRVSLASDYAISAILSPDNKRLTVLSLTGEGSRVAFYDLSSEITGGIFDHPGGLILDIRYLTGGDVLAVTQESLITIDAGGNGLGLYSFSGRRLGGYAQDGDLIALYLLDYGLGYSGRLVTLRENGEILGELASSREIISMSFSEGYLAVLRNEGLSFYGKELDELTPREGSASATGATYAVALRDMAALAAGDHSAAVIRFERSAGP